MLTITTLAVVVEFVANTLTIAASAIAIYLFVAKRKEIAGALSLLLTWSFQTTLTDLYAKLDRLNEYNANEPSDLPEIQNILHEIAGQIRGNVRLTTAAPKIADRAQGLAVSRRLTEPSKRAMVAELREVVRNIQVRSLNQLPGESDE